MLPQSVFLHFEIAFLQSFCIMEICGGVIVRSEIRSAIYDIFIDFFNKFTGIAL